MLTCAVLNTLVLQFDFCEPSNRVFSLSAIQGYGVNCQGSHVLAYVLCLTLLCDSADFHDYHHQLLYKKSGNYSSTFTYMDW